MIEETSMDNSTNTDPKPTSTVAAKTPYVAPKLSIHGSVQQITNTKKRGPFDGLGGSNPLGGE
jgi:hypothetical protein